MTVNIHSRESIESIIANGKFPDNTAVISFYDPELKYTDNGYTHVDYSKVCNDVFYCEIDDLDLDYLPKRGYTYETFFPQTDDLAKFIMKAYADGKNIICQCEYGQSRSAGCAAAIKEYFYKDGISVFADYNYYPNQVVFHKVYDALVKLNCSYCNAYDSKQLTGVEALLLKQSLEKDKYCNSLEEAYYQLRHGIAKVNVCVHIDNAKHCHGPRMGERNIGLSVNIKYADTEKNMVIHMPKFTSYVKPCNCKYYLGQEQKSVLNLKRFDSVSLDLFGIMELDYKEPVINKSIITNIIGISKSK